MKKQATKQKLLTDRKSIESFQQSEVRNRQSEHEEISEALLHIDEISERLWKEVSDCCNTVTNCNNVQLQHILLIHCCGY